MALSRQVGNYQAKQRKAVDFPGMAPALLVIGVALTAVLLANGTSASATGLKSFSPYALVAASLVCVIGLGVLARIVLGTQPGKLIPQPGRSSLAGPPRAAGLAQPVVTVNSADYDPSLLSRRLQTIDELTKRTYWEQDANGNYLTISLAKANEQHALIQLQGSQRGGMEGDWFEPESCRDLPAKIVRRLPFHDIVWYRTLPGGQILRLCESGVPRFDPQGKFVGYQGCIEEITAEAADTRPMRLALNALTATPLPCAIVHSPTRNDGVDRQWSLMWANQALTAQTEYPLSALQQIEMGQWFGFDSGASEIDSNDDESTETGFIEPNQRLNTESGYRATGVLINRYGEAKAVSITFEVIDQAQPGTSTVVIFDPISPDNSRLERESHEMQALRQTEVRRALELEATARELESFSHTVSHDLRAPIRHVTGFAELLAEKYSGVLDSVGMDSIARIVAAGQRMDGMLDALVELHRISSTPVVADPLDLSSVAQSIATEMKRESTNADLTIEVQPGIRVRGDHMLIRIVMWNLISNATKFSSRNPHPRITISQDHINGVNTYTVSDNGVGFNSDAADGLFRPFARLHSTADYPGTGIGLATVQRIVRRHGGHIWAESTPGQGASFYFTLWG